MRVQIKVENGDILGREESCKLRSEVGNRNHKTCLDIYIYICIYIYIYKASKTIPREGEREGEDNDGFCRTIWSMNEVSLHAEKAFKFE